MIETIVNDLETLGHDLKELHNISKMQDSEIKNYVLNKLRYVCDDFDRLFNDLTKYMESK